MTSLIQVQNNLDDFLREPAEKQKIAIRDLEKQFQYIHVVDERNFAGKGANVLVPMNLTPQQDKLWEYVLSKWENKHRIRCIILKERQGGFSTFVQALIFLVSSNWANLRSYLIAEQKEKSEEIFQRTRRFWMEFPEDLRRPVIGGYPQKQRIQYAPPLFSQIIVSYAENIRLGRGLTPAHAHLSEFGWWPQKAEETRQVIQTAQAGESENYFTSIFVETTAHGSNHFHQFWRDAENGDNGYDPLFFPWVTHPTYFLPLISKDEFLDNGKFNENTPDIASYADKFKLSRPRLKWMLHTLKSECDNDIRLFHQEYPASPTLAFQTTSQLWFDAERLEQSRIYAREHPPLFQGTIIIDRRFRSDIVYELKEELSGPLKIWDYPRPGFMYVMSLDPGMGLSQDWGVGQVWRLPAITPTEVHAFLQQPSVQAAGATFTDKYVQVAEYRSNNEPPEMVTMYLWCLGHYFGYPLFIIGRTGMGRSACMVAAHGAGHDFPMFRRYPRLYTEMDWDKLHQRQTKEIGFAETKPSKDRMLSMLRSLFNEGSLVVHSLATISEFEGFSWEPDPTGRMGKGSWIQGYKDSITHKAHDDCISSNAMAYMGVLAVEEETLFPLNPSVVLAR